MAAKDAGRRFGGDYRRRLFYPPQRPGDEGPARGRIKKPAPAGPAYILAGLMFQAVAAVPPPVKESIEAVLLGPGIMNVADDELDVRDGVVHAGVHHGQPDDFRQHEKRVQIAIGDIPHLAVVEP